MSQFLSNPNAGLFGIIKKIIVSNDRVLFMKGSKAKPACGFSFAVVRVLNELGLDFYDVDVLLDNELKEALKIYSDWPTIPQLYYKKELVGGCDIVMAMYENDSLRDKLST